MTEDLKTGAAIVAPENDFRRWRKAMGWTIEKTASALEKHYRTIQRYERGEEDPPESVRLACCMLALMASEPDKTRRALYRFRREHGLRGLITII